MEKRTFKIFKILTAAKIAAVILSACTEATGIGVAEQNLFNETVSVNLSEWEIIVNDSPINFNDHYPYKKRYCNGSSI